MKPILILLLVATAATADTNYFVYVKATGAKVHSDTQMTIDPSTISADGKTFKDFGLDCGICANTTTNYWTKLNTNQLQNVVDLNPRDFVNDPDMQALDQATRKAIKALIQVNKTHWPAGSTPPLWADFKSAFTNLMSQP